MDAMPVKELIANELQSKDGNYCTLGVVGAKRGIDLSSLDPEASEQVAQAFDIAEPLAQEIVYLNDELQKGRREMSEYFSEVIYTRTDAIVIAVITYLLVSAVLKLANKKTGV
jgi:hypothetical protein